ncbi:MAG: aspartate/glutamate racemase family protein [Armatimonadota bacterium]|nr:aspartate/glutamate racemase family protein [Armatimonadota bacterium]
MKILVLNPNTSDLVTSRIADQVRRVARPDTQVDITQLPHGPETLESYYDESLATPHIVEAVKAANRQGYDAVVLAAFCDPGLEALKEVSDIPVYGIEETTFSVALLLGNKFGILTERKHKESVKWQHVRKHGLEGRFASVRAMGMGVAEIAEQPERAKEVGLAVGRRMIEEDGAEVIIMGCASMAGHSEDLERALGVPILDPIAITFKVAEGLADLRVRHSKIGLYATPVPKTMK